MVVQAPAPEPVEDHRKKRLVTAGILAAVIVGGIVIWKVTKRKKST